MLFEADSVSLAFDDHSETLLKRPRYEVFRHKGAWRLKIRYRLPKSGIGVSGEGVIVLQRSRDGWLRPVARYFKDPMTGSLRSPLTDADGLMRALEVAPCRTLAAGKDAMAF